MCRYVETPETTATKHTLKAARPPQSLTELGKVPVNVGSCSPVSAAPAAETVARGAQPWKQLAGAMSEIATFGFFSSFTRSAQAYSAIAQLAKEDPWPAWTRRYEVGTHFLFPVATLSNSIKIRLRAMRPLLTWHPPEFTLKFVKSFWTFFTNCRLYLTYFY